MGPTLPSSMAVGSPKSLAVLQTSPRPSGLFVPLGHYLKIKTRSGALSEGRSSSRVAGVISGTDIGLGTKQNKEGGPDGAAGGDHSCPSKPQSEPRVPESQNEQRIRKSEQKGRIYMKVWLKRLFIGGKHKKQKIKYLFEGVHFVLFSRDSSAASLKLWFSRLGFPGVQITGLCCCAWLN